MRKMREKEKDNKVEGVRVEVPFDGRLTYPKRCVACDQMATDKTIPFTLYNTFYTRKIILNFPICEDCYQAKKNYINLIPVVIFGPIITLLSIYTLLNQPEYLPFSPTVHLIAGFVWLAILFGYITYLIMKAKRENTEEVVVRRKNLLNAVKGIKYKYFKRQNKKELIMEFTNESFAKDFRRLNRGKFVSN